jgi:hypothetical protein
MRGAITNPPLLLLIRCAECSEIGLRQDSSSAGRRFDPYTARQISQPPELQPGCAKEQSSV